MRSDLLDLKVARHFETEKALLVSGTGLRSDAVWLPKAQVEIEPTSEPSVYHLTLPTWLAKEKGLI